MIAPRRARAKVRLPDKAGDRERFGGNDEERTSFRRVVSIVSLAVAGILGAATLLIVLSPNLKPPIIMRNALDEGRVLAGPFHGISRPAASISCERPP